MTKRGLCVKQGIDTSFCGGRKCLRNNQIPLHQGIGEIFIIIRGGQIGHQSLLNLHHLHHHHQRKNRANRASAPNEKGQGFYQMSLFNNLFHFFQVWWQPFALVTGSVTGISNESAKMRGQKNLWYHPKRFSGLRWCYLHKIFYSKTTDTSKCATSALLI